MCEVLEDLEFVVSKHYDLGMRLIVIKDSFAFKFRGMLSPGYWAITEQHN
jgi:hypothetical protein